MATLAELTEQQKAAIDECVNPMREYAGELKRLANHAAAIKAKWTGNVETIIASLDAGEIVPDNSTIPDAEPLPKELIQSLAGYLVTDVLALDTDFHRSVYVKAAGVLNTIG